MPNIQPISILREKETLDKVNRTKEPLFITKNGTAYLVLLSPDSYDEMIHERDQYKKAFEREKEIRELAHKIDRSRKNIKDGKYYSEEEFDKIMENIL
ncbi:type II toxin-antitoxin system Phd/YefM family antitoxin [candidate division KSB1 bacterium]|nr:type II toxin-antitoxin system Phd/YefM family antitoxin [candidate division KSB1 bacterium]